MKKEWKLLLVFIALIPCVGIGLRPNSDFSVYTKVGLFLEGPTPELLYEKAGTMGNFFYGVPFLPLAKAFTFLSLPDTYWFWLSLQIFSYVGFWFVLFRLFPSLLAPQTSWLFLLVWAVSIKPIHASFQSANVQLMFAFALALGEYLSSREEKWIQFLGGSVIAPLVLFKIFPFYVIVAYFFLKPRAVFNGMVFGFLFWLLLPFAYFTPGQAAHLYHDFGTNILKYHTLYSLGKMTVNLSLPSLISFWFLPLGELISNRIALFASLILSFGFLLQMFQLQRRGIRWSPNLWAYTLAVMTLLNSGARPDYFIFYVPAFAAMTELFATAKMPKWFSATLFASFALIALISEWTLGSRELGHALEQMRIPVFGMVLLWFLLLYGIKKPSIEPA